MPKDLADILLTIRIVESGERYTIGRNRGGASGAYQYIDATWNNFKGYPSAYLAPPEVQDERAAADVRGILAAWNNDVSMIPVIWYYPRAARDPRLMDIVPRPQNGNRLTVREYQTRWLDTLEFIVGQPLWFRLALLPPELRFLTGIPPELGIGWGPFAEIAFPVLGKSLVAPTAPCPLDDCGEGTDAVVYGQQLQPILSVSDGIVTAVEPGDAASGAVTVTVTDVVGRTYRYAGFNDDNPGTRDGAAPLSLRLTSIAKVGTQVRAGQILGFMGDTDVAADVSAVVGEESIVIPHLRLTIHNRFGTKLDADRLVLSAQTRQACHVAIGPWAVPVDPRLVDAETPERGDVEVSAWLNGGWILHDDGTVTAYGKSTMIVPPQDCSWSPPQILGPGAGGESAPLEWLQPVEILTRYFVRGSQDPDTADLAAFVRH